MARVGTQPRQPSLPLQGDQRPLAPQTIAHEITVAWWHARVEAARGNLDTLSLVPFDAPKPELSSKELAEAHTLGRDIATLSVVDACAELGRIYTHALSDKMRATDGVYYTPPPLVGRLLDKAEQAGHDWLTGSAIDPSCGGGAFLVDAA